MPAPVVPPGLQAVALDGSEPVRVVQGGRYVWSTVGAVLIAYGPTLQAALAAALAPVLQRLGAAETALAGQVARDAAQDAALAGEQATRLAADVIEAAARQATDAAEAASRQTNDAAESAARQAGDAAEATARTGADATEASARQAADAAEVVARLAADAAEATARQSADATEGAARQGADAAESATRSSADVAESAARTASDAAQASRLAALEARPEEVAHFSASAKLPAVAIAADVALALAAVPKVAGDVLRAGEDVAVEPVAALPAGLSIASARVTADGVVTLQLRSSVALAAGTAPVAWSIVALR